MTCFCLCTGSRYGFPGFVWVTMLRRGPDREGRYVSAAYRACPACNPGGREVRYSHDAFVAMYARELERTTHAQKPT